MWDQSPHRIALLELVVTGGLRRRQEQAEAWDELATMRWTRRTSRQQELELAAEHRVTVENLLGKVWPGWRAVAAALDNHCSVSVAFECGPTAAVAVRWLSRAGNAGMVAWRWRSSSCCRPRGVGGSASMIHRRVRSFRQDLADHETAATRKLHWLEKATRVQVAAAWLKLPHDTDE